MAAGAVVLVLQQLWEQRRKRRMRSSDVVEKTTFVPLQYFGAQLTLGIWSVRDGAVCVRECVCVCV